MNEEQSQKLVTLLDAAADLVARAKVAVAPRIYLGQAIQRLMGAQDVLNEADNPYSSKTLRPGLNEIKEAVADE